jgi:hypothetical protein
MTPWQPHPGTEYMPRHIYAEAQIHTDADPQNRGTADMKRLTHRREVQSLMLTHTQHTTHNT